MSALVKALGICKLKLQFLVLIADRSEFISHSISLLLSKAILVCLLQGVPLTILDPLQQLDLLLKLFVLPLHIKELVFEISYRALNLYQIVNLAILRNWGALPIRGTW